MQGDLAAWPLRSTIAGHSRHDPAQREAAACGDATEKAIPWKTSDIIAQTAVDLNLTVSEHNRP